MPDPVSAIAAVSVGTGIIGAVKSADAQSDAAKNATRAQTASTDKQLALQREMYGQTRQDLSPYSNYGAFATERLGKRMGMPAGYGSVATGLVDKDTQYYTPQGLASVPRGSTVMSSAGMGGRPVGMRTPTGGYIDTTYSTAVDEDKADKESLAIARGNLTPAQAFLRKIGGNVWQQ